MSDKKTTATEAPFDQWLEFWKSSTEAWQGAMQQAMGKNAEGAAAWLNPMESWKQWTNQWWESVHQTAGAAKLPGLAGIPGLPGGLPSFPNLPGMSGIPGMPGLGAGMMGLPGLGAGALGGGPELFLQLGQWWWKTVLQAAQKGPQAWQEAFRPEQLTELQGLWTRQLGAFADQAAALPFGPLLSGWTGGLSQLSQLGGQIAQRLMLPWGESFRDLSLAWQEAVRGNPDAFRRFARTWKETYDKTHGRLLQAPLLGYSREPAERLNRSMDAFVDYLANVQEFSAVLDRVGRTAIQRWYNQVSEMAAAGKIPSHREVYRLYIETMEQSYVEVFRSREYSRLQAQMVDAGLRFKRSLDRALEDVLEFFPVPTESEMRELYQAFHELRATVKSQRQELTALRARLAKLEGNR